MPTREEILARKVGHGTVTHGDDVYKIRALSRDEALRVHELREADGVGPSENLLISLGLTDPKMTPEDMAEWATLDGSAGPIIALSMGIGTISGMTATSGKESYKSA